MKAHYLLKKNIDTLLRARGQSRHDLAVWCRRGDSWISQIFTNPERELPLKYLDRIADFFGIATYQLFQPGISPLTERRKGQDRRSGQDRRVSRAFPQAQAPSQRELAARFAGLDAVERRKVEAWMEALVLNREARPVAGSRPDQPPTAETPRRGTSRRRAGGDRPPQTY